MALTSIEIMSVPVRNQERAKNFHADVLGCDDIEQTAAELTERGVSFNEDAIAEAPWGRWLTFADPDGNGWVLQQTSRDFSG